MLKTQSLCNIYAVGVQQNLLCSGFSNNRTERHLHSSEELTYFIHAKEGKYQIWERTSLSVDIWSREVLWQELQFLHQNPVRANVCRWPEEYQWSSALFYHTSNDNFGWLTHAME